MTSAFRVLSSGALLTALVLSFSESHLLIGVVGAIPLLAKGAQLIAHRLLHTFGAVRLTRIAAWVERVGFLGGALAGAFRAPHTLALILAGFAVGTIGGALYDIGLTALSAERVSPSSRGRFFGARVHWSCMFAVGTAVLAGILVDVAEGRGIGPATARSSALLLGIVPAVLAMRAMRRFGGQPVVDSDSERAPEARREKEGSGGRGGPGPSLRERPAYHGSERRLLDRPFRATLVFAAAWGFSTGLTARHVDAYALQQLQFSVGLVTILAGMSIGAGVIGARTWGRMGDKFGARPILVAAAFVTSLNPVWYAFATPEHPWPFVAAHVVGGIANAGWLIGVPLLMLNAPLRRAGERMRMLALFQATAGVTASVAPIIGGVALHSLARFGDQTAYFSLFIATALLRLGSVWLLSELPADGSRRVRHAAAVLWRVHQIRLGTLRAMSERVLAPFKAPF
ncbi:MAG: MFS transporter [Gemmatimonadaceae bacterium]